MGVISIGKSKKIRKITTAIEEYGKEKITGAYLAHILKPKLYEKAQQEKLQGISDVHTDKWNSYKRELKDFLNAMVNMGILDKEIQSFGIMPTNVYWIVDANS